MMKVNNKYTFGDIVYLITDPEQLKRVVTAIIAKPDGILYEVSQGVDAQNHYECELSDVQDIMMKTSQ